MKIRAGSRAHNSREVPRGPHGVLTQNLSRIKSDVIQVFNDTPLTCLKSKQHELSFTHGKKKIKKMCSSALVWGNYWTSCFWLLMWLMKKSADTFDDSCWALRGSVAWPCGCWSAGGMHGAILDVIIIMALGNVANAGMLDIMAWLETRIWDNITVQKPFFVLKRAVVFRKGNITPRPERVVLSSKCFVCQGDIRYTRW